MSIQFIPPEYTRRPQSTSSKVGQKLGELAEGASKLYLQKKIEGYFDRQKSDAFAEKLGEMTGHKEWIEPLKALGNTKDQLLAVKEIMMELGAPNDPFFRGSTETPKQPSQDQNLPSEQNIKSDLGMPSPEFNPLLQMQYQPGAQQAAGNAPINQQPTVSQPAIAPTNAPQTILPTIEPKPSEEEFLRRYNSAPKSQRPGILSAYNAAKNSNLKSIEVYNKGVKEKTRIAEKISEEGRTNSGKFMQALDKENEQLIIADNAIQQAENAVKTGDVSSLRNIAANAFHMPWMQTASAAQFAYGIKTAYVNALGKFTRPNMFLEQYYSNVYPSIGKTTEANMATIQPIKYENALNRHKQEFARRKADEYEEKLGYIPGKISRETNNELIRFSKLLNKQMAYNVQEIHENELSDYQLRAIEKAYVEQVPLTLRMYRILLDKNDGNESKALGEAKKMGYDVNIPDQILEHEYMK
jgi:hypothetical protein